MLGKQHGKTNFYFTLIDLFDIILGQEFFKRCHVVINSYLQHLIVIKQGGSCMVPLVKVPKSDRQA